MIENKYEKFILYVIAFVAIYNVAEYFFCTMIRNTAYVFSYGKCLITPLIPALISGVLFYLLPGKKK